MRTFLESMGKLTVFVICAQMLVYFRPKQAYEKYLKLLMNLLILLQLLLPIGNFLRGGTELDLRARYEYFQSRMEEYMEGTAWRVYDRWGTEEGEGVGEDEGLKEAERAGEGQWTKESQDMKGGQGMKKNEGMEEDEEPEEAERGGEGEGTGKRMGSWGGDRSGFPADMEAIERVEIPDVKLGGRDEQ